MTDHCSYSSKKSILSCIFVTKDKNFLLYAFYFSNTVQKFLFPSLLKHNLKNLFKMPTSFFVPMITLSLFGFSLKYIKIDLFLSDTMIFFLLILYNKYLLTGSFGQTQTQNNIIAPQSSRNSGQNDGSEGNQCNPSDSKNQYKFEDTSGRDGDSTRDIQKKNDGNATNSLTTRNNSKGHQNNEKTGRGFFFAALHGRGPNWYSVLMDQNNNRANNNTPSKLGDGGDTSNNTKPGELLSDGNNSQPELQGKESSTSQESEQGQISSTQQVEKDPKKISFANFAKDWSRTGNNGLSNGKPANTENNEDQNIPSPVVEEEWNKACIKVSQNGITYLFLFKAIFNPIFYAQSSETDASEPDSCKPRFLGSNSFICMYVVKHEPQCYDCYKTEEYILDKKRPRSDNDVNTIYLYKKNLSKVTNKPNNKVSSQETFTFYTKFFFLKDMKDIHKIKDRNMLELINNQENSYDKFKILIKCLDMKVLEKKYMIDNTMKKYSQIKIWTVYLLKDILDDVSYGILKEVHTKFKLTFRVTYKHFVNDKKHKEYPVFSKTVDTEIQTFFFDMECNLEGIYHGIFTNLKKFLGLKDDINILNQLFIYSLNTEYDQNSYFTIKTRNFMILNMFNYGGKNLNTVLYCILSFKATKCDENSPIETKKNNVQLKLTNRTKNKIKGGRIIV